MLVSEDLRVLIQMCEHGVHQSPMSMSPRAWRCLLNGVGGYWVMMCGVLVTIEFFGMMV
jgi:hypothetical protein